MATHRRRDGRTLGLLGLAVTLILTFAAAAQQTERFDDRVVSQGWWKIGELA